MRFRTALILLCCLLVALPACSGGSKKKKKTVATVSSAGPSVTAGKIPKPPALVPPKANEVQYVAHIVDKATGNPIGGCFVTLLRNIPEPDYMRVPKRADVITSERTPMHGQVAGMIHDASQDRSGKPLMDGKMKYWLLSGRGFLPKIVEAGNAVAGQKHEVTIRADITPVIEFRVILPNGDLAPNCIGTMAPDEAQPDLDGKMADRGNSSGNVGMTERGDDAGVVWFNRKKGRYRLSFSAETGKYRHYEIFEFDGKSTSSPIRIQLPEKSMAKPW